MREEIKRVESHLLNQLQRLEKLAIMQDGSRGDDIDHAVSISQAMVSLSSAILGLHKYHEGKPW